MSKIYVGQVGVEITLDTGIALAGATATKIRAKRPGRGSLLWDASIVESTKVQYTTEATDLSEAGDWCLQAYVEIDGAKGYGETVTMAVYSLGE